MFYNSKKGINIEFVVNYKGKIVRFKFLKNCVEYFVFYFYYIEYQFLGYVFVVLSDLFYKVVVCSMLSRNIEVEDFVFFLWKIMIIICVVCIMKGRYMKNLFF